jgi:hypothetical protein
VFILDTRECTVHVVVMRTTPMDIDVCKVEKRKKQQNKFDNQCLRSQVLDHHHIVSVFTLSLRRIRTALPREWLSCRRPSSSSPDLPILQVIFNRTCLRRLRHLVLHHILCSADEPQWPSHPIKTSRRVRLLDFYVGSDSVDFNAIGSQSLIAFCFNSNCNSCRGGVGEAAGHASWDPVREKITSRQSVMYHASC